MSYAAASSEARAAYVPPGGDQPLQVGTMTFHFLRMPLNFEMWQFIGLAFIIFVIARHWGRFVNTL